MILHNFIIILFIIILLLLKYITYKIDFFKLFETLTQRLMEQLVAFNLSIDIVVLVHLFFLKRRNVLSFNRYNTLLYILKRVIVKIIFSAKLNTIASKMFTRCFERDINVCVNW